MNMPGYSAEMSLRKTKRFYNSGSNSDLPAGNVQPAFNSCFQTCGGDPDCMQCCICVRHGGHPWDCCF